MHSSIFVYFAITLIAVSALPNKSTITQSAVTSTSLATVTEIVNLTSTVTASSSPSAAPESTVSVSANATSPAITSGALTDLLSATTCNTAGVSVITSVVTQVSTKTVDHFITVTAGAGSSGNGSGSKGQNGNLGAPPTKPTETPSTTVKQSSPPVITTMATVKLVTTVVVEQTTTVFVTSFVTTTVEVKGGATRTHTTMATSTVTSTGMATHTRTKTSTMLITLTKTDTSVATTSASSTSNVGIKDTKTSTSAALSSSSPCPTDPVTLTVTRSASQAASTSKAGIKDANTSSSRIRFTTKIRETTSLKTASSSTRTSQSATTTNSASSSVVATSKATSRTDTKSTSASGTTTSARATTTASRFSTSIVRNSGTVTRVNTRTSSSSAPAVTSSAGAGNGDPQTSLNLDSKVIMSNLANDGQDVPTEGQVASLTSRNNFINFCATQNVPLTNGQQIKTGSCNGVPMGRILAVDKIPTSKFVFPKNGGTVPANKAFTVKMAIRNLKTGNFVNPATNYYSAPAQTTDDGTLIGHSHVVIELLSSKDQVKPTDPQKFVFFKGLNLPDVNGVLSADVTAGLPAGDYRMASINTAANHQSALPAVAQRGSVDDMSYFSVV